jgi:hypothetical protein
MYKSALLFPRHRKQKIKRLRTKSAACCPVPGIISVNNLEIYSILAVGEE